MFKKVLLATDGSKNALRAAERASYIASLDKSIVTILYVVDAATSKSEVLSEGDRLLREENRKQRIFPTESLLKNRGIDIALEIKKGDPGPTIANYANENQFDLVVVGSRGLNRFQEMVLGSVSHKVAKRVNCPVMIVK
ncbi:universal stress protein [Metabacillus idriensis]|uniref:universal stress protein n=1 Tax=Metabacillus idriensis TaxID=324768 RepID=UPI00203E908E|nr:universal stress protein [Metabacillus idriensis]MCM3594185.1 universal stress protein [Metabacillus idriensis]